MTGTERIGAFSQHNLLVGSAIVGTLVFAPLASGAVLIVLGFAELVVPTLLLAAFVLFVVFAVGSYALAPRIVEALNLDVRLTSLGYSEPSSESWAQKSDAASAVFPSKVRVWQIGNLLIMNHEPVRVLLRVRIRVNTTLGETVFVWASGVCVRGWTGMRLYVEAGDLPHLPTEIPLGAKEHIRGHTEFVADLESNDFPPADFGEIVIEDLLTGRSRVYEQTDWETL